MFNIKHIKNIPNASNYVEVHHSNESLYAKIDLNLGGSLQELILHNKTVINSEATAPYKESFASAILFPFVNRISHGVYMFKDSTYQLTINKEEEQNAIHGLVYNKTFTLINHVVSNNEASILLRYIETETSFGFPFKYQIELTYFFTADTVKLKASVKNIDTVAFPFTIGWHPYFIAMDLSNCSINLDCCHKIVTDKKGIPTHEEDFDVPKEFKINDIQLDDCFKLNSNHLKLKTADYNIDFSFSSDENYAHLYIPPNRKTIAIEPQTGAANSFNNKLGLKELQPTEHFDVEWTIQID